jgi:orotate phosphoribosyltransferase
MVTVQLVVDIFVRGVFVQVSGWKSLYFLDNRNELLENLIGEAISELLVLLFNGGVNGLHLLPGSLVL